jgi:hypothetical protein
MTLRELENKATTLVSCWSTREAEALKSIIQKWRRAREDPSFEIDFREKEKYASLIRESLQSLGEYLPYPDDLDERRRRARTLFQEISESTEVKQLLSRECLFSEHHVAVDRKVGRIVRESMQAVKMDSMEEFLDRYGLEDFMNFPRQHLWARYTMSILLTDLYMEVELLRQEIARLREQRPPSAPPSSPQTRKVCTICQQEFKASVHNAQFCSPACKGEGKRRRDRRYRKRKRARRGEKQ